MPRQQHLANEAAGLGGIARFGGAEHAPGELPELAKRIAQEGLLLNGAGSGRELLFEAQGVTTLGDVLALSERAIALRRLQAEHFGAPERPKVAAAGTA